MSGKSPPMIGRRVAVVVLCASFLMSVACDRASTQHVSGAQAGDESYFGQLAPGERAERFAPDIVSFETHDSPIIPRNETWMILGGIDRGTVFYGLVEGVLAPIENPLGYEIPAVNNGLALSRDADKLLLLIYEDGDENFYVSDKTDTGWTERQFLGEEVNSLPTHWQFTLADNGNLYFASGGIVVSVHDGESYSTPARLKLEDGSDMAGSTPFIAPDESYLLLSLNDDLHISYHRNDSTWTTPQDLGEDINSPALENCPRITPNGKHLFFISRRIRGEFLTFWADAGFVEKLRPGHLR